MLLIAPLYHCLVLGCLGTFEAVLSCADAAKLAIASLPHVMFEAPTSPCLAMCWWTQHVTRQREVEASNMTQGSAAMADLAASA